MANEFKVRAKKILKNQSIDGGSASQVFIKLPEASTSELSALPSREGSIAFDTTLSEVVIDSGSGFSPISPPASGADDKLSNLDGPTEINTALQFASGQVAILKTTNDTVDTQNVIVASGDSSLNSGPVQIQSGDAAGGNSGDVTIQSGSASGTRGDVIIDGTNISFNNNKLIDIVDPSSAQDAATKNYVDNSIVTALSKLVAIGSSTSVGGSASEVLTFTGLLATDIIIAISPAGPGANNTAITGFDSISNNSLNVKWTADPGANAAVIIMVYRP